MAPIAIPPDCFIRDCERVRHEGERRWRSEDRSMIYTWDGLHGEIEVYNDRGRHLGVMDCEQNFIKEPVKGRRIDV